MKIVNKCFLIVFLLLITLPIPFFFGMGGKISRENTENKAEESFPDLTRENYSTWSKRFDSWLSDNLPFKTQFIHLFRGMQFASGMDYEQSDVIRGKDGWLFYRKTEENYKGLSRFSDEELQQMRDNVTIFFAGLRDSGTKGLFFIAPDKEQVYARYMPEEIHRESEFSAGDQVQQYLSENMEVPVFYPKEDMQNLSMDIPLYFKTDTHWNELGGYYAAQQIKAFFGGEPGDLRALQTEFHEEPGKDLANMLGLKGSYQEANQYLIDFADGITPEKTETVEHGTLQRYHSNSEHHKKLIVLGDSFAEYYIRSAIHDTEDILFITFGELSRVDLTAEAPDYFVLMLVERNLPFLLQGFY